MRTTDDPVVKEVREAAQGHSAPWRVPPVQLLQENGPKSARPVGRKNFGCTAGVPGCLSSSVAKPIDYVRAVGTHLLALSSRLKVGRNKDGFALLRDAHHDLANMADAAKGTIRAASHVADIESEALPQLK